MTAGAPPTSLLIAHDEDAAADIGITADGRQFFLTQPFVPALDGPGCEFVAMFIFDAAGNLIEAIIDNLGPRKSMDRDHRNKLCQQRLDDLGPQEYRDIRVKPFRIERFGIEFGLIPRPPEEPGDPWWVVLTPGEYMAFTEPWDGTYDT